MELLATFYGDAMAFFDKVNAESIGRAWGVLAENRKLVTLLFSLFVSLYFVGVALGHTRGSIQDAAIAGLKLVLAYSFIMSWPDFKDLIGDVLIDGPEQIGAAIASKMGGINVANDGMAGLVRNVAWKSYNFAAAVMQANESWWAPNLLGFMCMVVVLAGLIPLLLVLTGVTLFAKFITAIALAIGPFAIMAYFFSATRFIFASWMRALALGFFMLLFAFVILGLSFSFLDQVMGELSGDYNNTGVFAKAIALALYLLLIVFFVAKTPAFAQSFAFGTALNLNGSEAKPYLQTYGDIARLGTAYRKVGSAGLGAGRGVGRSSARMGSAFSRQLTARIRRHNESSVDKTN